MKKSIFTMLLFAMTITITAQTARVQVIHNSADAAAEFVDVYLNDALLIPNFEFRTASPFIDAPAGEEIELSVAPPNSSGVEEAIFTAPVTLTEGETYVVVADGIVSGSGYNPPQDFGLQIYPLGREAASDPANTDVLVHHGSTDAPAVDVVETGVGAGTIVDDLAYTEFQGYLELPTADYTLQINTADGSTGVVAYAAPLATLALDGAALVAVASGFLDPSQNSDGPAFGIYVALPAGGELVALPSATLGVEDFDINTFVMYPNPTASELNFEYSTLDSNVFSVIITDTQGRTVVTNTINASNQSMDVTNLSSGLYQVLIMDGNDLVGTKKLLKK
jgi:hypothetical protein